MAKETTANLGYLTVGRMTLKLENWTPVKNTPLQNQAYCAVQRMSLILKSCWRGTGCSRVKPTEIITVRKSPDVRIENEIGDFFKGLNFIAHTFTDATLNTSVLSELLGYIHLYETDFLVRENDGGAENVTISLVVDKKPESLIEKLKSKVEIKNVHDGILHFKYDMDFQIIITDKLHGKEKAWLMKLLKH